MVYVFCNRKSDSARELAAALDATRLRRFDGMDFWVKNRKKALAPGDTVVCWGCPLPDIDGVKIVNGARIGNKYEAAMAIGHLGLPTITVGRRDGAIRSRYFEAGYIGRTFDHVGGEDILHPVETPDFYVMKENFSSEYRIHTMGGKSIRAGKKVPRDGHVVAPTVEEYDRRKKAGELVAHPWVRSFDAGWRINYDNFESNKTMRALAWKAVSGLELQFGAVDIAQRTSDGKLIVLEVNRAPGAEGGTVESYVRGLKKLISGEKDEPETVDPAEETAAEAARKAEIRRMKRAARRVQDPRFDADPVERF